MTASAYTKSLVSPGQNVWLEKDISDTDKYGRLLRYIWLDQPTSLSDEEVRDKMLNAILVEQGCAIAKKYPPDTKYSSLFKRLDS